MRPWLNGTVTMRDPDFIDEQRNADFLDAMADMAYELDEAMRETDPSDWEGVIYDDENYQ